MRLFVIAAAIVSVFIGVAVHVKNRNEQQRQFEFQAKLTAAIDAHNGQNPNDNPNAEPIRADSAHEASQKTGLEPAASEEGMRCETKTSANIQRCLARNNIQNGGEEAGMLIGLSRGGHAEFIGLPHESNGKCRVDIRITGRRNDKDVDRLLNDCEVD